MNALFERIKAALVIAEKDIEEIPEEASILFNEIEQFFEEKFKALEERIAQLEGKAPVVAPNLTLVPTPQPTQAPPGATAAPGNS